MLSWKRTEGKGRRSGRFEGDVDWPFPKRATVMMKYFLGFSVLSSPISQ